MSQIPTKVRRGCAKGSFFCFFFCYDTNEKKFIAVAMLPKTPIEYDLKGLEIKCKHKTSQGR